MISARLRQQRFYGWTVLVGAMLVSFSMVGSVIVSYGLFLPTMCKELDWSRSALSAPYTAFWIVMGLLGPLVGISISKFGARKNSIWGNLVIVLGVLGMSLVKEIWHVYLFYAVLIGTGQAFGTFLATTTVVNTCGRRWCPYLCSTDKLAYLQPGLAASLGLRGWHSPNTGCSC